MVGLEQEMEYGPLSPRKRRVMALIEGSGGKMTLTEIGRWVGVSRQAVWKMVRRAGLSVRKRRQYHALCPQCGGLFTVPPSAIRKGRRFCSLECAYASRRRVEALSFVCQECGEIYTRMPYQVRGRTRWCSNVCRGRWLKRTYHGRPLIVGLGSTEEASDVRPVELAIAERGDAYGMR